MEERRRPPIETFDHLLRELAKEGLAGRVEVEGVSSWQLTDEAQNRLEEIAHQVVRLLPEQIVHLDHTCANCNVRGTTRLHEGLQLCESCLNRSQMGQGILELEPVAATRRWAWPRRLHAQRGKATEETSGEVVTEPAGVASSESTTTTVTSTDDVGLVSTLKSKPKDGFVLDPKWWLEPPSDSSRD